LHKHGFNRTLIEGGFFFGSSLIDLPLQLIVFFGKKAKKMLYTLYSAKVQFVLHTKQEMIDLKSKKIIFL